MQVSNDLKFSINFKDFVNVLAFGRTADPKGEFRYTLLADTHTHTYTERLQRNYKLHTMSWVSKHIVCICP